MGRCPSEYRNGAMKVYRYLLRSCLHLHNKIQAPFTTVLDIPNVPYLTATPTSAQAHRISYIPTLRALSFINQGSHWKGAWLNRLCPVRTHWMDDVQRNLERKSVHPHLSTRVAGSNPALDEILLFNFSLSPLLLLYSIFIPFLFPYVIHLYLHLLRVAALILLLDMLG